jgi:thymidylate kinase
MIINKSEYSKVIRLLKRNKISLIDVLENKSNRVNQDFLNSTEFSLALSEEKNHLSQWRNDFIIIKKEWDKANIDYMFHKSTGQFPYMSDNLDVLVRSKDFKKAGEILVDLGYVNLRNIQEAHKEFYRKFIGEKVIVPIHLHERVCWSVPYEDIEHLWDNYVISDSDETLRYPDFDDGIVINSAHCFLEDHIIKIYDLLIIKKCIDKKRINWDYVFLTAEKMHWLHSLNTAFVIFDYLYSNLFNESLFPESVLNKSKAQISGKKWILRTLNKKILNRDIKMPFNIPHLWTRFHTSIRVYNDITFGSKNQRIYQIFSSLLDGFIHSKLKIKSHPSFFITFSGLDGSGKTKHIDVLQKNFLSSGIKTHKIWSRAGSFPFVNNILKIMGFIFSRNSRKIDKKETITQSKRNLPKNKFINSSWVLINIMEMIIFYFVKIRVPLWLGKVIIADRYIYDSIIDLEGITKTGNFNRGLYRLLFACVPKPDISFYLDLHPTTILERGSDEIEEELNENYEYYNNITRDKNFIIIDNSIEFDFANQNLTFLTLSNYFNKYPEKFKGYKVVSFRYQ